MNKIEQIKAEKDGLEIGADIPRYAELGWQSIQESDLERLKWTDDGTVNAEVAAEARARGTWVNAADDPPHCDFTLPSVLRRGELTVAVSTRGTSPALARAIREELESYFTDDYRVLADVAGEARREAGTRFSAGAWRRALDGELLRLIAADRREAAKRRLLERLQA